MLHISVETRLSTAKIIISFWLYFVFITHMWSFGKCLDVDGQVVLMLRPNEIQGSNKNFKREKESLYCFACVIVLTLYI